MTTQLDAIEVSLAELVAILSIRPQEGYELRATFVRGSSRDRYRLTASITAYIRTLPDGKA